MNNRENLRALLNFKQPDELCQYEWGYWSETLARWEQEGLPADKDPWTAVGISYYHRVPVETRFFPLFEEAVLSEDNEKKVIQDEDGIVKEVFKNKTTFPRFIKHPVESMGDLEEITERLDPHSQGRFPADWAAGVAETKTRDSILVMGQTEISFFGWPRVLMGLENLLVAYYDQPELIHAINHQHLNFLKELYAPIMAEVEFDYIFMWEDMCFKNGPLISPAMFREFMLPYYQELIAFFKDIRDYKVLVDSDGDVTELIPLFIEGGVDGILPFEVAAGMDIRELGETYPNLIIAGGIDKREIAKGKAAIDCELEDRLPKMFKRSGYCPSMDHHVPPEVSYTDFQYYLEKTRQIFKECH